MTSNRIEKFLDSDEIKSVLKHPHLVSNPERLIDGPKTYQALVQDEMERAKQEGREEVWGIITKQILERIQKYISELVKLGDIISRTVDKALPELSIVSYRAKISMDTNYIKVLFVINASVADEINFTSVINSIEQMIAKEDSYLSDVLFVNEREKEIDYASVKSDFPFILHLPAVVKK